MGNYNITLKDLAIRSCLDIKMNTRYLFNTTKKGDFEIPTNYSEIFSDDFKSDYHNKWDSGSELGLPPYHPSNPKEWYDNEQIKQTDRGIELSAIIKPKYFDEIKTTIQNAVGFVRTKDCWKYGIFSFTAQLPIGTYLWPALWLSGRYNWPPEIDILEGYSTSTNDYHKNKELQSNIHFKNKKGNDDDAGARSHKLPNRTTKELIEYVLWWEEDFIKIYYNGYLVRHITDKTVLNGMFESQRIILNTATDKGFNKNNLTPFIIKEVKVYQK